MKREIKDEVKEVAIDLLNENATKKHKTKIGKLGAILSRIGAIILPFVNIKKK